MEKKRIRGNKLLLLAILLLVPVAIISGLLFLESTFSTSQDPNPTQPGKTIVRDGVEYFPRTDVTTVLLAGVDEPGHMEDSGSYNNDREADMVALLIFDETNKTVNVLMLNRDTMVTMPVLGLGGKPAGTREGQLALAHTYGSGLEDSSENLCKTVSDYLYGVDIDHYLTMGMDAVALLNDAVGGVTVTVEDDFSAIDPSIPTGQVTLNGQQALKFVQTRYGVGDQLNLSRMNRHKAYMQGFVTALKTALDGSSSFVLDTYSQLEPYTVTDCSVQLLATLADRYSDYTMEQVVSIQGENKKGEYMEFYPDPADLDRVIIEQLYAPKK